MNDRSKCSLRLLTAITALLALMASGQTAHVAAQEPPAGPPSKVDRKNKAPVSTEILRVKVSKPVEVHWKNGLTVLIVEDHRFPAVFVHLHMLGAGSLFEPDSLPGMSDVTAKMLREGTPTRTSKQISEELDKLGATLTVSSPFGSDAAVLSASGLSDNFDAWFSLVADILLHPTFPIAELAKLKQRLKAQLRQQRSDPRFLANERFNRAVFGNHPAAVVSPTAESVDALTQETVAKWHRERYAPRNAILGIAGDIRAAELIAKLEKLLVSWQNSDVKRVLPPDPAPASVRKISLVDRPNSVQTTLVLGNIAINRRSPDYVGMVVLNHLLGGGPASRLFLNLREEKGFTYGIYSDFTALGYPGPWRVSGNMRTEVTHAALAELLNEIRRIRDEQVSEAELEENKRAVVAGFALSLEQPAQILDFAITRKIYNLPDDYWDTYPAKVIAVTAQDVQQVARKYLNPESMQLVAVGDGGKIKPILEKYGPVQVFDSEGNSARVPKE